MISASNLNNPIASKSFIYIKIKSSSSKEDIATKCIIAKQNELNKIDEQTDLNKSLLKINFCEKITEDKIPSGMNRYVRVITTKRTPSPLTKGV